MGKERHDDLTARVLAWQHRHPLAIRLEASQVLSPGWVALPFVVGGKSAEVGAMARAAAAAPKEAVPGGARGRSAAAAGPAPRHPRRGWMPVFDEPVVESCSTRRLARWAMRHGVEVRPAPDGLPLREVAVDSARAGAEPIVRLWVRTAMLDSGGARSRLLVGDGRDAPVLGRRLWSRPRLGVAAAALVALLAGAGVGAWIPAEGPRAAAPAARLAATAVPSAAVAARTSSAQDPGPPPAGSESERKRGAGPLDAGPAWWQPLDDAAKREARETVAAARAARSHAAASAPAGPLASSAVAPVARVASVAPPVWAVSTRVLRTRFESEQMLVALRAAAARSAPDGAALRFEVLPVGSDWRAVSWPFSERRSAERLRDELHARGLRVEVLAF